MKGGHAASGRAPDPNAIRRDRPSDQAGWTTLPASRQGDPPEWPLVRPKARELVLWAREWARPQAVMWETLGLANEVAIYVRTLVAAENPKAPVALRTLLRQQQEALGLSAPGLNRLRWRIGGAPDASRREETSSDGGRRTSAASRFQGLTVIDGDAG